MPALILLAAALALLAPAWMRGLTPFWGDLTYIHHPWETFAAQVIQAGRAPLWDPYLYFGMPLAAKMQNQLFYPGQLPFFLFKFVDGLALYQLLHFWLAGWLTFLWLRSLRLSRGAALTGALLFGFSGIMVGHQSFTNHLAALSLVPALFLFYDRPLPLAVSLCMAYLAGYPPFLAGSVALAWGVLLVVFRRAPVRPWAAAAAISLALSAVQLIPGLELMSLSRRSGGVEPGEMLKFGFALSDLAQWVSPALVSKFQPAVEWWKCCYLGFAGFALAALGLLRLRRAGFLAAAVLLLILGESNPASRWVWLHLTPLHFVRYPGNLAYLALPLAALLGSFAAERLSREWRAAVFCAVLVELLLSARGVAPLAPRRLFTTAGPYVEELRERLEGRRYLLSPLALETHAGKGVFDWKTRLYGMTNGPYRLRAAGNFGEPLVPRRNYELMDFLYSQRSLESAMKVLPDAGVAALLLPAPDGWRIVDVEKRLPMAAWPREDRFTLSGEGGKVARVLEPRYPGWRAWLNGQPVKPEAEGIAFQKVAVPDGPWTLEFKYEPFTWTIGLWLTLAALLALGAACYNRLCAAPIYR